MTFNEGMQIDTSTTSTGGGGGGRGIAIGGGVGGLVIVLLALFLGVDPGRVVSQQPALPPGAEQSSSYDLSKCKTGADANKYVECRVVATGNSVDDSVHLFVGQGVGAAELSVKVSHVIRHVCQCIVDLVV